MQSRNDMPMRFATVAILTVVCKKTSWNAWIPFLHRLVKPMACLVQNDTRDYYSLVTNSVTLKISRS
jgi:hypothetical protein